MGNRLGTMPADECRSVVVHMDIHKREFSSQKNLCSFFLPVHQKKKGLSLSKKSISWLQTSFCSENSLASTLTGKRYPSSLTNHG